MIDNETKEIPSVGKIRLLMVGIPRVPFALHTVQERPIIFSMTDDSIRSHTFSSVISELSLEDFLKETKAMYPIPGYSFRQHLFFDSLDCGQERYSQVVCVLKNEGSKLFVFNEVTKEYLHFDFFELMGPVLPKAVSKEEYDALVKSALEP